MADGPYGPMGAGSPPVGGGPRGGRGGGRRGGGFRGGRGIRGGAPAPTAEGSGFNPQPFSNQADKFGGRGGRPGPRTPGRRGGRGMRG